MESEFCSEKMKNEVDSSRKTSLLENASVVEAEILKVVDGRVDLEPITPNPDREKGEAALHCMSPLTCVSSTPLVVCFDSGRSDEAVDLDSSPRTPKGVFDPFAPGPDDMLLAPWVKKYTKEARYNVSRRLNFDLSVGFKEDNKDDDDDGGGGLEIQMREEILLESVYESFLDAIVSKQMEGVVVEYLSEDIGVYDGFKTPTILPLLNGIAETCPSAPKKPILNSRSIDPMICRKLEF